MSFDQSTIAAAIGVVLFLGAAATFLRGSKDKGTITTLSSSNAALWEKIRLFETEVHELNLRVQGLEDTKKVLTEAVTQAAAVSALQTTVQSFQSRYETDTMETNKKLAKLLELNR